jgi:hypothetical protein
MSEGTNAAAGGPIGVFLGVGKSFFGKQGKRFTDEQGRPISQADARERFDLWRQTGSVTEALRIFNERHAPPRAPPPPAETIPPPDTEPLPLPPVFGGGVGYPTYGDEQPPGIYWGDVVWLPDAGGDWQWDESDEPYFPDQFVDVPGRTRPPPDFRVPRMGRGGKWGVILAVGELAMQAWEAWKDYRDSKPLAKGPSRRRRGRSPPADTSPGVEVMPIPFPLPERRRKSKRAKGRTAATVEEVTIPETVRRLPPLPGPPSRPTSVPAPYPSGSIGKVGIPPWSPPPWLQTALQLGDLIDQVRTRKDRIGDRFVDPLTPIIPPQVGFDPGLGLVEGFSPVPEPMPQEDCSCRPIRPRSRTKRKEKSKRICYTRKA